MHVTDACHTWSAAGANQQSVKAALAYQVCSKTQSELSRQRIRRATCRWHPLLMQVGVHQARRMAGRHGLKYIPVHHMEAHALIARAGTAVAFPFLCLLVSGGHNMLVVVEGVGSYTLLGATLDDAVGRDTTACHQSAEMNLCCFHLPAGRCYIHALRGGMPVRARAWRWRSLTPEHHSMKDEAWPVLCRGSI